MGETDGLQTIPKEPAAPHAPEHFRSLQRVIVAPKPQHAALTNEKMQTMHDDIITGRNLFEAAIYKAGIPSLDSRANELYRFMFNAIKSHGISEGGREWLTRARDVEIISGQFNSSQEYVRALFSSFLQGLGNYEEFETPNELLEDIVSYFTKSDEAQTPPEWMISYLEAPTLAVRTQAYVESGKKPEDDLLKEKRKKPPADVLHFRLGEEDHKLQFISHLGGSGEGNLYVYVDLTAGKSVVLKVFNTDRLRTEVRGEEHKNHALDGMRTGHGIQVEANGQVRFNTSKLSPEQEPFCMYNGPAIAVLTNQLLEENGFDRNVIKIHDWGRVSKDGKVSSRRFAEDGDIYLLMNLADLSHSTNVQSADDISYSRDELELLQKMLRFLNNEGIIVVDAEVAHAKKTGGAKELVLYDTSVSELDIDKVTSDIYMRFAELQAQLYGIDPKTFTWAMRSYKKDASTDLKGSDYSEYRTHLDKRRRTNDSILLDKNLKKIK